MLVRHASFRRAAAFFFVAGLTVASACDDDGATASDAGTNDADLCEPSPSFPPPPSGGIQCTAVNQGETVCTTAGGGYVCSDGCWAPVIDSPCDVRDAGR